MIDAACQRLGREALSGPPRHRAFIGLGGNLGDVPASFRVALQALAGLPGTSLEAVSSLYVTRPVDSHGPDYINAVAVLNSALGPEELLRALQRLENEQGRERPYVNAPRSLDLDLLWYGDVQRHTATLTLPHPRMMQRGFVLVPLIEVLGGLGGQGEPALTVSLPDAATCSRIAAEQGVAKSGALTL